jgi:CHAT domain-containing protein
MPPPLRAQVARSVQTAVRWLKVNEPTITDARDCAIAISALVAAEKSSHARPIQHLVRKLRDANRDGTSWNDEVWDTVWAVRALLDQSLPRKSIGSASEAATGDPSVTAALEFLVSVRDSVRGFWYGEPFETMIALDLLFEVNHPNFLDIADRPIEWLLSLQSPDGRVIAPHFTGIFASVFSRVRLPRLPRLKVAARAAGEWLIRDLHEHHIWTSAAWSNAHALQGVIDSGFTLDDPEVVKAVEWFLKTQSTNGEWSHVATVDDTSMAVLALTPFLSEDLVDVTPPLKGTMTAIRTNGSVRLTFEPPAGAAVALEQFIKFPEDVAEELRGNEMTVLMLAERLRSTSKAPTANRRLKRTSDRNLGDEILEMGAFAHGHLYPPLIEKCVRDSRVDHLRLNVDESLIDLPWELIHDGEDFLCVKYAVGRHIFAAASFPAAATRKKAVSALVVSDPRGDLPGALSEGRSVARLLRANGVLVTVLELSAATKQKFAFEMKRHDIVHFAGHATRDDRNPDESCLILADGPFKAFRLSGFFGDRPPALVFLNACWSASERSAGRGYPAMMRGLGRTFIFAGVANFIGYVIPVSDALATTLALHFYQHLVIGRTVGESLRRSRIELREKAGDFDPVWASAILYGDPVAVPIRQPAAMLS